MLPSPKNFLCIANTFIFLLLFNTSSFSQVPEGINYQAVARDMAGIPMDSVRLNIYIAISNSVSPPYDYEEIHSDILTNRYGLFNLIIGQGLSTSSFSSINWGSGNKYIGIAIDTFPEMNFTPIGLPRLLMSVPYALYAKEALSAQNSVNSWKLNGNQAADTTFIGTINNKPFVIKTNNTTRMFVDSIGNVGVGTTAPAAKLDVVGQIKITDGTQGDGKILTSNANGLGSWVAYTNTDTGTVTSFSADSLLPLFTTTITNDSTTPHLSFSLSDANPYTIFGNNSNTSATPAYFNPVLASPLFQNQGDSASVLHGNSNGSPSWGKIKTNDIADSAIDLSSTIVTGTLPVINGGTGTDSVGAAGSIVYSDGAAYGFSPAGTSGQILELSGTGTPVWTKRVLTINGTAPVSAITTDTTTYTISIDSNTALVAGVVAAGGTNYNKVWKTDVNGNPGWRNDSSGIAFTAGTGLSLSGDTLNSVWTSSGNNIYKNNTGNIGIGTTTPSSPLTIQTIIGKEIEFTSTGSNADIYANAQLNIGSSSFINLSAGGLGLSIDNLSNVGIGTISPGNKLQVAVLSGTANVNEGVRFNAGTYGINIGGYDLGLYGWIQALTASGTIAKMLLNPNGGNVGIGTTAPGSLLHVAGAIQTGVGSSTNGALVFNNTSNSNTVTIQSGNTSPSPYTLTLPTALGANNSVLYHTSSGNLGWASSVSAFGGWATTGNSAIASDFIGTTNAVAFVTKTSNVERMRVTSAGNVGIGTATPASKLTINDTSNSLSDTDFMGALDKAGIQISTTLNNGGRYNPGIFWQTSNDQPTKPKAGIWTYMSGSGSKIYMGTSNTYSNGITNRNFVLDQNGNVGIGTNSPTQKLVVGDITGQNTLRVNGLTSANMAPALSLFRGGNRESVIAQTLSGLVFANTSGVANYNDATLDAAANMIIRSNGNVGIGTTTPNINGYGNTGGLLTIQNISGTNLHGVLELSNRTDADSQPIGDIAFSASSQTSAVNKRSALIRGVLSGIDGNANNRGSALLFYTRADGGANDVAERMRIDNNGNVGIGTTTPSTYSRLAIKDGHLQSQQTVGSEPTVTGVTNYVIGSQSLSNATDVAGNISIAPTFSDGSVTVTFNKSYSVAPIVILTPTNVASVNDKVWITTTTNGFTVNIIKVTIDVTPHTYSYHVIETQ